MKPLTRKEIAIYYGYGCTKTFTSHLKAKEITLTPYKLVSMEEQLMLYSQMGIPAYLPEEELGRVKEKLEQYCTNNEIPFPK